MAGTALEVRPSIVDAFIPRAQASLPAPTDDFWYGPVGGSSAGQRVTGQTALTLSSYWAASNAIAGLFGMLPCKSYRKKGEIREEAVKHDTYRIVGREPNPDMDSFIFWEMMTQWWVRKGNAFAEIQRRESSGGIFALWPIHPSRVKPERTPSGSWTGRYLVKSNDGKSSPINSSDMFNIVGPLSDDGIIGKGIDDYAMQAIGIGLAQMQYEGDFYSNGGRPSGILQHPSKLSAEARDQLRREWRTVHGKSNEVAVLWEDMKFNPLSVDPEHAKLIDSRVFTVQEMCRFFDLPPHALYELSKGTFANTEEMNRFLVSQPFGKRQVRVEKAMDRQLFTEEEKKAGYYTKFNVKALLRGDPKQQAEINNIKMNAGVMSQDEWRAQDDQNPLPDGLGETHWMRRDMAPIELVLKSAEQMATTPIPDTPPTPETPPTPDENAKTDAKIRKFKQVAKRLSSDLRDERSRSAELLAQVNQIPALQSDIAGLRALVKNEKSKNRSYIRRAISNRDLLRERTEHFGQQEAAKAACIAERDERLAARESELVEAREQLVSERQLLSTSIDEAKSQLVAVQAKLDQAIADKEPLESQVSSLNIQISDLNHQIEIIHGDLQSKTEELAVVCADRDQHRNALDQTQSVLTEETHRAAGLERQLTSAQQTLDEVGNARDAAVVERDKVKSQLATIERQELEHINRANALQDSIKSLESQLSDAKKSENKAKTTISSLESEISTLKASIQQAKAESDASLNRAVKRGDDFKSRVDDLSSQLGIMRAERDSFRNRFESIGKSHDESAAKLNAALQQQKDLELSLESAKKQAANTENDSKQRFNSTRRSITASLRTLLDESLQFLLSQEQHEVKTAARKPDQFKQIINGYYHHLNDRLTAQLSQVATALEQLGGQHVDVAKITAGYVAESRTKLHNVFHQTPRDDLRVKIRSEVESWESRRQTLLDWIGE